MASTFPTTVDTFSTPTANSALNSPSHSTLHVNENDAIIAAQSFMGLVLVKSQTIGTTVTSVTVTGAFSSTFDNYQIRMSGGTQTDDQSHKLILGASVTGYYGFLNYGLSSNNTPLGAGQSNQSVFNFVGGGTAGQASFASFDLFSPFAAAHTKIRNASYQNGLNYGTMQGEHQVATSFTAFTLAATVGTLTGGTIRVYGYRQ